MVSSFTFQNLYNSILIIIHELFLDYSKIIYSILSRISTQTTYYLHYLSVTRYH